MKTQWMLIAVAAAGISLSACNRAESPGEAREDVAEAQRDANENVMEEQAEGMRDGSVTAGDQREILLAEAEGRHKVEVERCESLSGDAQRTCKEQADETLERAKEQARNATGVTSGTTMGGGSSTDGSSYGTGSTGTTGTTGTTDSTTGTTGTTGTGTTGTGTTGTTGTTSGTGSGGTG